MCLTSVFRLSHTCLTLVLVKQAQPGLRHLIANLCSAQGEMCLETHKSSCYQTKLIVLSSIKAATARIRYKQLEEVDSTTSCLRKLWQDGTVPGDKAPTQSQWPWLRPIWSECDCSQAGPRPRNAL